MKLIIQEQLDCDEIEVTIQCRAIDETVLRIAAAVHALDHRLVCERDGSTFLIDPADVCYIESVDKNTFLYTAHEVYQTPLRLYEVEERYAGGDFFRAGKSAVINLRHVRSMSPVLGGRIELELNNGEKRLVSRQYVPALKQKLGMKG